MSPAISSRLILSQTTILETYKAFKKNVGEAVANPTQLNSLKGYLNLQLYPFPIILDLQNTELKKHSCFHSLDKPKCW